MKHTIENPNPIYVLLRAVINLDSPLREIEQTSRSKISMTPIKYALTSFSTFMKCLEVMKTPPARFKVDNDTFILFTKIGLNSFYFCFVSLETSNGRSVDQ